MTFRRLWTWLLVLGAIAVVVAWGGSHYRLFRPPYHGLGKEIAWLVGEPEAAYNFDVVGPGHILRSSQPDGRFVQHLRDEYGLQRIVSLIGETEAHATARALGIEVTTYDWSSDHLPPRGELEAVLGLLDETAPVLVHCKGGLDRTGYTMAFYRVTRQGWTLEDALEEMTRYWHVPERHPAVHAEMRDSLPAD